MKIFVALLVGAAGVAADKSGLEISRDEACVWMGSEKDISLCRSGDAEFTIDGALVVEGDASFAGDVTVDTATFSTSDSGTNTLADLDDAVVAAQGDISANTADISANTADISTNAAGLASAVGDVSTNTAAISANADAIASNLAAISANAAVGSENAAAISDALASISVNVAAIESIAVSTTIPPNKLDQALKEARCSRVNCCNTDMEWVDANTLHCWSDNFDDFESDPCSCTVKFVDRQGTWKWHERYCTDVLGGQLASVHSDTMAGALTDFDTSSASIFIGLHDYKIEDQWINTDGTPTNWKTWNTGEPNDSNGEDCAEIYPSTAAMNDIDCATVYSNRYVSACTIMEPNTHHPEAVMDIALQEARCSRVNCCHENADMNDDGDEMYCYRSIFDTFEQDPCGCTVKLVIQDGASWKWHDNHCVNDLGGQLFSIHSSAAVSNIDDFFGTTSVSIFVGLHDFFDEDYWMNTDGTVANYIPWNTGEPNDSSGEDCVEMYSSTSGLNDIDCWNEYDKASLCTIMTPSRNFKDTTDDGAEKEARCSRVNCCNENYQWLDSDTLQCWSASYDFFEGDPCSCTVEFTSKTKSWKWHDRYCSEALGGQLFSIHSDTAAAALIEFDTSSASIYVGLHDFYSEDAFFWTDGTPFNWEGWNSGEPNDSNNEDCAEIYPSTSKMNDIDCDTEYSNRYVSACSIMNV